MSERNPALYIMTTNNILDARKLAARLERQFDHKRVKCVTCSTPSMCGGLPFGRVESTEKLADELYDRVKSYASGWVDSQYDNTPPLILADEGPTV